MGKWDPYGRTPDSMDGEEATPSPLKSRRLLDMPEFASPSPTVKTSPKPAKTPTVEKTVEVNGSAPACSPKASRPTRGGACVLCASKEDLSTHSEGENLPPNACAVLSVSPSGEGETVAVVLALHRSPVEKAEKLRLQLLVEQYAELGVKAGQVTYDFAEELIEAARLCAAIRRGMALLRYGDQSARRLAGKLMAKGVDRDVAAAAVAYLTRKGYIHEESTATLRAEQGVRKGWGPRRIYEDLRAHGFTESAAEEAMEALSEEDWEENCAAVIRKRYGEIPYDRADRQKLVAALMRLGYDSETVRGAMRRILREK